LLYSAKSPFFGIVMMTDFAHSSGTLPIRHIRLQIAYISSVTFSPPAGIISPVMSSIPELLPFFNL